MATGAPIDPIIQQLIISLQMQGITPGAQTLEKLKAQFDALKIKIPSVNQSIESMSRATDRLAQGEALLKKQSDAAWGSISSGANKGVASLAKFATGIAGLLVGFTGIKSAFKDSSTYIEKYNNALRDSATAAGIFGTSIGTAEQGLESLGAAINATRLETMKMFQDYANASKVFSQAGFDQFAKNIRKAVGPSIEAMGRMQSSIQSVTSSIPELAGAFERLGEGDKRRIDSASRLLLMNGKINDSQFKAIQSYIAQSSGATAADRKRLAELDKQQAMFEDMERHYEGFKKLVGQQIVVPLVKEFSSFLRVHGPGLKKVMEDVFKFLPKIKDAAGGVFDVLKSLPTPALALVAAFGLMPGLLTKILGGIVSMGLASVKAVMATKNAASGGGGFGGLGKMGKVGGAVAGIAAAGAYVGSGFLSDNAKEQREKGNIKNAGINDVGGAVSGVAGDALTGAAVGSFIPVIGTAVGAIGGAAVGLVRNFDQLSAGISEIFGGKSGSAVGVPKESDEEKAGREKADQQKKALADWGKTYQDISAKNSAIKTDKKDGVISNAERNIFDPAQIRSVDEEVAGLSKKISLQEKSLALQYEAAGVSDSQIKSQENLLEQVSSKANEYSDKAANSTDAGESGRYAALAEVAEKEKKTIAESLELLRAKREEIQGSTKGYTENLDRMKELKAEQNLYMAGIVRQKDYLESIADIRQSEIGILDAIVARQNMLGKIDLGEFKDQFQKITEAANLQQEQLKFVLELQTQQKNKNIDIATAADQINSRYGDMSPLLKAAGFESIEQLLIQGDINKLLAEQDKIMVSTAEKLTMISAAHASTYANLSAQTNLYKGITSLADNFAVGVAASAEMRMNSVRAMGAEINQYEIELAQQKEMIAFAEAHGQAVPIDAHTKLLEIQGKIVSKTVEQAQETRALRDGWVDAISAMNTGAGRFTKIMLTGDKNIMTGMKSFGMLATNKTGSLKGGFTTSEQFSASGVGNIKNGKTTRPYDTHMGDFDGAADSLVGAAMRGDAASQVDAVRRVSGSIQKESNKFNQDSASGLALGANSMLQDAATAGVQGRTVSGFSGATGTRSPDNRKIAEKYATGNNSTSPVGANNRPSGSQPPVPPASKPVPANSNDSIEKQQLSVQQQILQILQNIYGIKTTPQTTQQIQPPVVYNNPSANSGQGLSGISSIKELQSEQKAMLNAIKNQNDQIDNKKALIEDTISKPGAFVDPAVFASLESLINIKISQIEDTKADLGRFGQSIPKELASALELLRSDIKNLKNLEATNTQRREANPASAPVTGGNLAAALPNGLPASVTGSASAKGSVPFIENTIDPTAANKLVAEGTGRPSGNMRPTQSIENIRAMQSESRESVAAKTKQRDEELAILLEQDKLRKDFELAKGKLMKELNASHAMSEERSAAIEEAKPEHFLLNSSADRKKQMVAKEKADGLTDRINYHGMTKVAPAQKEAAELKKRLDIVSAKASSIDFEKTKEELFKEQDHLGSLFKEEEDTKEANARQGAGFVSSSAVVHRPIENIRMMQSEARESIAAKKEKRDKILSMMQEKEKVAKELESAKENLINEVNVSGKLDRGRHDALAATSTDSGVQKFLFGSGASDNGSVDYRRLAEDFKVASEDHHKSKVVPAREKVSELKKKFDDLSANSSVGDYEKSKEEVYSEQRRLGVLMKEEEDAKDAMGKDRARQAARFVFNKVGSVLGSGQQNASVQIPEVSEDISRKVKQAESLSDKESMYRRSGNTALADSAKAKRDAIVSDPAVKNQMDIVAKSKSSQESSEKNMAVVPTVARGISSLFLAVNKDVDKKAKEAMSLSDKEKMYRGMGDTKQADMYKGKKEAILADSSIQKRVDAMMSDSAVSGEAKAQDAKLKRYERNADIHESRGNIKAAEMFREKAKKIRDTYVEQKSEGKDAISVNDVPPSGKAAMRGTPTQPYNEADERYNRGKAAGDASGVGSHGAQSNQATVANVTFGQLVINIAGFELDNIRDIVGRKVSEELSANSPTTDMASFGVKSGSMEGNRMIS